MSEEVKGILDMSLRQDKTRDGAITNQSHSLIDWR